MAHYNDLGADYILSAYGELGEEMAREAQMLALSDGNSEDAAYWGRIADTLAGQRRRTNPAWAIARNIVPFRPANENCAPA